jgi:8-oxo-dGTP pyrophosphatase MutT (NUDIX family)
MMSARPDDLKIINRNPSKQKSSAYLILYYREGDEVFVLMIQKQVIHYGAILDLRVDIKGDLAESRNWLAQGKPLLNSEGKFHNPATGIKKRFSGSLIPTGGKWAFPGGGFDKFRDNKSGGLKATAIRETKEELLLGKEFNIPEDSLQLVHREVDGDWTGEYYMAEINPTLIDVAKFRTEIAAKEASVSQSMSAIYNRTYRGRVPKFEIHNIEWVRLSELIERIRFTDETAYTLEQLEMYSHFLCTTVFDMQTAYTTSLMNNLIAYRKNECVDGNIAACHALLNRLNPRVSSVPPPTSAQLTGQNSFFNQRSREETKEECCSKTTTVAAAVVVASTVAYSLFRLM